MGKSNSISRGYYKENKKLNNFFSSLCCKCQVALQKLSFTSLSLNFCQTYKTKIICNKKGKEVISQHIKGHQQLNCITSFMEGK